jgi:nucleotide-binding universal stress UspA family protein
MGAHGERGFNRFLLGSITERILRESDVPVLSVRVAHPATVPTIRHILCPVNFSDIAIDAFRNAVDISKMFAADLVALHVVEPGADELQKEELSDKLCAWVSNDFPGTCTLTHLIRKGNASEQILEVASSGPCDLIVLGIQHKHFFDATVIGSTTARVARHAACPVLAVPGKKP